MRWIAWLRAQPRRRLVAGALLLVVFAWFMPGRSVPWKQPFVVIWLSTTFHTGMMLWNGLCIVDLKRPFREQFFGALLIVPLGLSARYVDEEVARDPTWYPGRSMLGTFLDEFAPYAPAYLALLAAVALLGWVQRRRRGRS